MFNNVTIFSLFKNSKNETNLSIKQLYVIYSFFKFNRNEKNTFILYTVFLYTFFKKTKLFKIEYLFLSLLFWLKTQNVLNINILHNNSNVTQSGLFIEPTINNFASQKNNFNRLSTFWKKWRNLKRPKTSENFNDFFLNSFKKKINTYVELGFIKTVNTFFFLSSSVNLHQPDLVTLNKNLLVTPKFSSSSIAKYIDKNTFSNFEFQFLRKNKVYNKGRYSRCRQNYRTGVYMCMYLSVCSIFGLYYWFYKFSFNFTYLWWLFIVFVGSFFLPKIIKYRLYEPSTLLNKFFDFFRWINLLIKSLFF